jgi:hypothetical protein
MPGIKKGERFIVLTDFTTTVLTHWRAPMTDGLSCTLPKGAVLVVASDSPAWRAAFICVPEDREAFVLRHIPVDVHQDAKFAGISIVIKKKEIGTTIAPA